jgi:Zn-dependent M28 family amino/carboxypeptidase
VINDFIKASAPSRMVGQPGHEGAKQFLLQTLKAHDPKQTGKISSIDFDPDTEEARRFYQEDLNKKFEGQSKTSALYLQWFNFVKGLTAYLDKLKVNKASNIVWEKQGLNSNKLLVVTAHYDTINVDSHKPAIVEKDPAPGANYNASGVSIALSLVKVLAQMDLNYSVRVVFLDWQALGYLGSYQYARELKSWQQAPKEVMGVVNLEMLGQDTSYLDRTKKTGNMSVYLRNDANEEAWVKKLIQHGSKVESKVYFIVKPNNFDQSDTFRFWEQDLKAATFSQNWEDDFNPKFYQTKLDTAETLNHDTLYGSYRFIGGAVISTLLDITR